MFVSDLEDEDAASLELSEEIIKRKQKGIIKSMLRIKGNVWRIVRSPATGRLFRTRLKELKVPLTVFRKFNFNGAIGNTAPYSSDGMSHVFARTVGELQGWLQNPPESVRKGKRVLLTDQPVNETSKPDGVAGKFVTYLDGGIGE